MEGFAERKILFIIDIISIIISKTKTLQIFSAVPNSKDREKVKEKENDTINHKQKLSFKGNESNEMKFNSQNNLNSNNKEESSPSNIEPNIIEEVKENDLHQYNLMDSPKFPEEPQPEILKRSTN